MSAMDEPLTKAEKLNVRQDQSLRDQQRRQGGTTFFERAQLDAALEHQGRFRDVTAATVVGATASWPRLPAGNSFASDPVGPEPLIDGRDCGPVLGYEIDERVPTSDRLAPEGDAGVRVTPGSPHSVEAPTPSTLSTEAEAERKAALADRMLQIKGLSAADSSSPCQAGDPQPMKASSSAGCSSIQTIRRRI